MLGLGAVSQFTIYLKQAILTLSFLHLGTLDSELVAAHKQKVWLEGECRWHSSDICDIILGNSARSILKSLSSHIFVQYEPPSL